MPDSQPDGEAYEEGSDEFDDEEDYDLEPNMGNSSHQTKIGPLLDKLSNLTSPTFRQRVRTDLHTAKAAGFKIGHLGPLLDGHAAYVSISCRMAKLGISAEAMQAWQVEPTDYLVLLLQYPHGYKTAEQLQSADSLILRTSLHMRVGACKKYKPTLQQAIAAFQKGQDDPSTKQTGSELNDTPNTFRETFISRPLNELLNSSFVTLLRYRQIGMGWSGAEEYFIDQQGCNAMQADAIHDRFLRQEPSSKSYPDMVVADHMTDRRHAGPMSFPLVAMQFLLRHFVRCTEFCLVCHRKVDSELEAIKPYVCDNPLCLYQYMSLGFGPSIEHEIIAQPYVVDLLISFCYMSAANDKLKDFPNGLGLSVPPAFATSSTAANYMSQQPTYDAQTVIAGHRGVTDGTSTSDVRLYHNRHELIFDNLVKKPLCPLRVGEWIVITPDDSTHGPYHCRVAETTYYPSVLLGGFVQIPVQVHLQNGAQSETKGDLGFSAATPAATPRWEPITYEKYNLNFDELLESRKCESIRKLLDTLPKVTDMKQYLVNKRTADLKGWLDRISPSALAVLRWIIASNRSCIVQVDDLEAGSMSQNREERLYGMKGWVQFRFAMGAPDKERRFLTSARETASRLKLKHPTLFAWHGSPLHNWHSIIREGLHFNEVSHGRAFGNGCYHSLQFSTSQGYSGTSFGGRSTGISSGTWPSSMLRLNAAMSLNEIVNAPAEFVSRTPHLVVAQLDWIQTRYLLVKCTSEMLTDEDVKPTDVHLQDPAMTPRGASDTIVIPAKASRLASTQKRRSTTPTKDTPKKKLKGNGGACKPYLIDGDGDLSPMDCDILSQSTDVEDLEMFFEDEVTGIATPRPEKPGKVALPQTDFVTGALDYAVLPKLPVPTYANPAATTQLQRAFRALLKTQQSTPLHELGWYIDPEKFDNVYQWVVELHSFGAFAEKGKDIPLVADMKKAGLKSIVLELRFPGNFPMSPPFVRVIGPRFLGFQQGGGGHVTAGGAMCMEVSIVCQSQYKIEANLLCSSSPTRDGLQCQASSQYYFKYDWQLHRQTRNRLVCRAQRREVWDQRMELEKQ